jgi:hypothetical protein
VSDPASRRFQPLRTGLSRRSAFDEGALSRRPTKPLHHNTSHKTLQPEMPRKARPTRFLRFGEPRMTVLPELTSCKMVIRNVSVRPPGGLEGPASVAGPLRRECRAARTLDPFGRGPDGKSRCLAASVADEFPPRQGRWIINPAVPRRC